MAKHPDFPSKTKDQAIEMLRERPRALTLIMISLDTGLSENWLAMFGNRKITHASIGRVEALHRYLTKYNAAK